MKNAKISDQGFKKKNGIWMISKENLLITKGEIVAL